MSLYSLTLLNSIVYSSVDIEKNINDFRAHKQRLNVPDNDYANHYFFLFVYIHIYLNYIYFMSTLCDNFHDYSLFLREIF